MAGDRSTATAAPTLSRPTAAARTGTVVANRAGFDRQQPDGEGAGVHEQAAADDQAGDADPHPQFPAVAATGRR